MRIKEINSAMYIEQENEPTSRRDSSQEKSIDEASVDNIQKLNPQNDCNRSVSSSINLDEAKPDTVKIGNSLPLNQISFRNDKNSE